MTLFSKSLLALSLTALIPLQAGAEAPVAGSASTSGLRAKETFSVLWARLQSSGFKGEQEGLDWNTLKTKHQPDIEGAQDIKVLRKEIIDLLTDLKASHFTLIPAEAVPDAGKAAPPGIGELGLRFALSNGKLLIRQAVTGFPAQRAGIRPGWSVDGIGKFDVSAALTAMRGLDANAVRLSEATLMMLSIQLTHDIAPGESIEVRLRDAAGKPQTFTLASMVNPDTQPLTLPGLPTIPLRIADREIAQHDGGCTLYFEYSQWATPVYERLAESLREHARCDGVVLDLRGNSGGMITTLTSVGGLFFDQPNSLGTMFMGDKQTIKLMSLPRQVTDEGKDIHRHSGRLAILVDRGSVSCSDIFPASLQSLGRARIFGTTSAGMALPAAAVPLPSGDRLMYPTADFADPKGRRIEAVGVIPDQIVTPTAAELSSGNDPVLDAALRWIDSNP